MVIPKEAKDEISEIIFTTGRIDSDQVTEILIRNGVTGDSPSNSRRRLKQLGQQYMRSFKDPDGKREIQSCLREDGKREYLAVDICTDTKALKSAHDGLEKQIAGLTDSTVKVSGRVHILEHFRKRWAHGKK